MMLLYDLPTTVPIFMLLLAAVGKLWDFEHQKMGQNLHVTLEDFCKASYIIIIISICSKCYKSTGTKLLTLPLNTINLIVQTCFITQIF